MYFFPTFLAISTKQTYEWIYAGIFVLCASLVYLVLVKRAGDDIPRKTIDQIFFLMLGVASVIWILSKVAHPA